MKASLQLKMGQQLTMTPQLQQAIRLLQLSSLELQQEIQNALETNPLLELDDEQEDDDEVVEDDDSTADSYDNNYDDNYNNSHDDKRVSSDVDTDPSRLETSEALVRELLPDELPVDSSWDDVYSPPTNLSSEAMFNDQAQGTTSEGLYEHLTWQKNLTHFSDNDLTIATAIIDAIDERGYLTQSCEDILETVGDSDIELDEVAAVLKRIQHFDPVGVAARDLGECLTIQLAQYGDDNTDAVNARRLVEQHLNLLASRDFRVLMKKTKLTQDDLRDAILLIQTLNPRPGLAIVASSDEFIIPDVAVRKKNGLWVVELNPDSMPKININQRYAAMASSAKNRIDGQFIRGHLQEAKWFLKSLESRNETLLKVASSIVDAQQEFFELGEEAMKPMVLSDIAQQVSMHESTISRVTTQKYMHTPRGIFELKYFFSSHVGTDDGGECSSTAIRALIKKLIATENQKKPLSDSKMAQLLAEQGINVARRTIAKYRETMLIPPSNQRKSL